MYKVVGMMMSAGIGAGLMYMLDPERGERRRSMLREQAAGAVDKARDSLGEHSQDMSNRVRGLGAEIKLRLSPAELDDERLAQRVRSILGHVLTHPGVVDVTAQDGRVTLTGPVLADEVPDLLYYVYAVPGVKGVEDRLAAHKEAGNEPALQGEPNKKRGMPRLLRMQSNWSSNARTLAGAAGGTALLYGLMRRGVTGAVLGLVGAGLAVRAASNVDLGRVVGIRRGHHGIDIQKSIHIHAPVDKVFEFWSRFENFPQIMANVQSVKRVDDQHTHWTVTGPAGSTIAFDTVVTAFEANKVIGWRTEADSAVQHAGIVRFHPDEEGGTTVEIKMNYSPIGGVSGHGVAKMLGVDPKRQMDEDMLRLKSFFETGKRAHDAVTPIRH